MCGIVGIVGKNRINQDLFDALTVIQHRGQDGAGMATYDASQFHLRKSEGLVREVFHTRHMMNLPGNIGIGHVRYRTTGRASSSDEAQPFYVNSPYGISLIHNGNLVNAEELKKELFQEDLRHINTGSDSEILLNVFANELDGGIKLTKEDIFLAVQRVHSRCNGAYAAIAMIIGYGLVAFRDPHGIRPLILGKRKTPQGIEYMAASEDVALQTAGFQVIRDIKPGETVYITEEGEVHYRDCYFKSTYSPCIFEYVYLARPDSTIDGISVYKARLRMAEKLGDQILARWPDHDIDVVIPIPDTSRACALPLAYKLNRKYREGLIKNRYIGRTFIMPGQLERERSVRQKLNTIELEFKGKNVLLIDDSIVRGTTSKEIVQMARDAGAKKVYFASAAPPVRCQNVYGINMPTTKELVAHGRTEEEVRDFIGADKLFYQSLPDLIEAVQEGNPHIQEFDTSCFSGIYPTGGVTPEYLEKLNAQE